MVTGKCGNKKDGQNLAAQAMLKVVHQAVLERLIH